MCPGFCSGGPGAVIFCVCLARPGGMRVPAREGYKLSFNPKQLC